MKKENNSEYYPKETQIIMRVLKRHGGSICENTFDRIFSQHKLTKRRDGKLKMSFRCTFGYFAAVHRHAPIPQFIGWGIPGKDELQQCFLWLIGNLVVEGKVKAEKEDGLVRYSIA